MRRKSNKTVNLTKINIAHREACAKHHKYRNYGDKDCGEWENRFKEATK